MVVANRLQKVYYPKACERLQELEDALLQILHDNGIKERIKFPITSKLEVFDVYDDIKKEYLVDFKTSDEEVIVFNPEYFTIIKDYNKRYLSDIKDYTFYYLQEALSFTSVEREKIKEDYVLGFSTLNSVNVVDGWALIARTFSQIGRELDRDISIHFKNNHTIEASLDGILVGFGRNNAEEGIMEAHYSLTDIYTVLNKRK